MKETVGTRRRELKESENKHIDASITDRQVQWKVGAKDLNSDHFCLYCSHLIETMVFGK